MRDAPGLARAILRAESGAAEARLGEAGFRDPRSAARSLERLSGAAAGREPMPAEVLAEVLASGSPDRALQHLERFLEATEGRLELYERLLRSPPLREGLARILAHSSFLTDLLVRHPGYLPWLFEETPYLTGVLPAEELRSRQRQALDGAGAAGWPEALRRFQRRELLRIGTAEILGCNGGLAGGPGAVRSRRRHRGGGPRVPHPVAAANPRPARRPTAAVRPRFCVVGLGKYGGR